RHRPQSETARKRMKMTQLFSSAVVCPMSCGAQCLSRIWFRKYRRLYDGTCRHFAGRRRGQMMQEGTHKDSANAGNLTRIVALSVSTAASGSDMRSAKAGDSKSLSRCSVLWSQPLPFLGSKVLRLECRQTGHLVVSTDQRILLFQKASTLDLGGLSSDLTFGRSAVSPIGTTEADFRSAAVEVLPVGSKPHEG
ncbi:unnamed protein product, partial [Amoebophrya sp. A25]